MPWSMAKSKEPPTLAAQRYCDLVREMAAELSGTMDTARVQSEIARRLGLPEPSIVSRILKGTRDSVGLRVVEQAVLKGIPAAYFWSKAGRLRDFQAAGPLLAPENYNVLLQFLAGDQLESGELDTLKAFAAACEPGTLTPTRIMDTLGGLRAKPLSATRAATLPPRGRLESSELRVLGSGRPGPHNNS
jgi:hypothetical protein